MHFYPGVSDTDLDDAINRTLLIGTHAAWKGRIARFAAESRYNPFARYYYAERFALEITMDRVRKYRRSTGRLPDILKADAETIRLFAFAGMLANVYNRLPERARKVLAGRVRGGLGDDIGLTPVAFELLIASHLMQKGADVVWHDLESGGFDFLARRGNAVSEVECKTFSADIGRKVHRQRHYQLGGLIYREMSAALGRQGSLFVDVLIEGRLIGKAVDAVAVSIRRALDSGRDISGPSPCSIALHRLSAADLPFDPNSGHIDEGDVRAFIETRFNHLNQSLLVLGRPGHGVAILATRSAEPDDVIGGMYEQLKRGATQFSGERPAFLCAHFLDLTPSQILNLHAAQESGRPSGLNLIATRLFNGNRPFLHTVQFTAPGLRRETQTILGNVRRRHIMESGPSYIFVNHRHPLAADSAQQLLA
jgi:hypothetical protein